MTQIGRSSTQPGSLQKMSDARDAEGADDQIDSDGPDGLAMLQVQQRGAGKLAGRGAAGDASADAGDAAGDIRGSGNKGENAGSAKGAKGPRGKRGRGKGKKGMVGKAAGPRVRRSEGRDRTEQVEQVSVLVGQDEGGGDAVEQAHTAMKRIMGDDENQNAFTATFVDDFDPSLEAPQIERLGSIQGAVHMVKLTDHWEESGFDRDAIIEQTTRKLLGFERRDQVKKVLSEMGTAPIKQVYPLEVMLRILDEAPEYLPKVSRGELLENRDLLAKGARILPEHEFQVKYPADFKLTAFALVGGGQPGYEFSPLKNGTYRMIIDTPGDWTFALAAMRKGETVIDTFTVHVSKPGRLSKTGSSA